MTTQQSKTRGRLKITQERVVAIICRIIENEGLEVARQKFQELNDLFSTEKGWAETAAMIYKIFAEKRKEEEQRKREEKLEELRIGAPTIVMQNMNKAEATNFEKVDQLNNVVEEGAEVIHTTHN